VADAARRQADDPAHADAAVARFRCEPAVAEAGMSTQVSQGGWSAQTESAAGRSVGTAAPAAGSLVQTARLEAGSLVGSELPEAFSLVETELSEAGWLVPAGQGGFVEEPGTPREAGWRAPWPDGPATWSKRAAASWLPPAP